MAYEIVITRIETVDCVGGREHKLLGERPLTEKDMEGAYHGGELVTEANKNGGMIREYGYTDEYETEKSVVTEVYKQRMQNLDLSAVILAINKLEGGE